MKRVRNRNRRLISSSSIIADQVSYRYGQQQALSDVCFTVPQGCLFGMLGPNGAGKTTLFRLLATLLPLQSGSVRVAGFDLKSSPAAIRRRLAVTFQSPALDPRLTVEENLWCHGRIYGIVRNDLKVKIGDSLADFGLSDRRRSLVGDLSGGLRRRAELAKCFLPSPSLALLDEPSTGLDPAARRQFWDLVTTQQQRHGTTIVVSTHLMEEAELCHQLLLLDQGQVVAHGTPAELHRSLQGNRLTIRGHNNDTLKPRIEELLGVKAQQTGDRICLRVDDAAADLQKVMQHFSEQVVSAEIACLTLDDVFMERTGHGLSVMEGHNP